MMSVAAGSPIAAAAGAASIHHVEGDHQQRDRTAEARAAHTFARARTRLPRGPSIQAGVAGRRARAVCLPPVAVVASLPPVGRRYDTRGAKTAFGEFEGQVEVDLPPDPRANKGGEELRPLQRVGTRRRALVRRPSFVGPLLWLLLFAGVLAGGYYGYCRYRVAARQQDFARELAGLRSALLELPGPLTPEAVRALVARSADRAFVLVSSAGIEATVEPLSTGNVARLSDESEQQRSSAELAAGGSPVATALVVGIKAQLQASYGLVGESFALDRYLRIDPVPRVGKPPPVQPAPAQPVTEDPPSASGQPP